MEPYIAIVVACISGGFAIIKIVLTKDQKTSELRQNWIDELRKEVSEFISINQVLSSSLVYYAKNSSDFSAAYDDFVKSNLENLIKIEANAQRILLRVNPSKDADVIKAVKEIEKYWEGKRDSFDLKGFNKDMEKLTAIMQKLLKSEWERVKKGERSYRLTKWITIAFSCITLIAIILVLIYGDISLKNIFSPPKNNIRFEAIQLKS